ncbi:MAG: DSD1 family PLP-dependent enzyme [Actinobacteria bacterium]|nr:DSD1 family PLP-dependent enzyme [Actinomycetota bacterium]
MAIRPSTIRDIDTPAAIIDLDAVKRNIQTMADYLRQTPVHIRPHVKTHKTPQIAQLQIAAGAPGVTSAKVGEAEAMVAGGVRDVLIANQITGPLKIDRLVKLAQQARVAVAVDDPANVDDLAAAARAAGVTIGVVVEVETGMTRCGVLPGQPAVDLARRVADRPGLEFRGLMGYEGHTVGVLDRAEREAKALAALQGVLETKARCEAAGLPVRDVTGGATNTYDITSRLPGWTELQCGTYATMDANYRRHVGHVFQQAFWVLASVISRPAKDRAILDCGLKSVTREASGAPVIDDPEGLELAGLSEEHGKVLLHPGAPDLKVGDRVRVTPWHGCTTFNLHDRLYVLQDDEVVDLWGITGRGRFT